MILIAVCLDLLYLEDCISPNIIFDASVLQTMFKYGFPYLVKETLNPAFHFNKLAGQCIANFQTSHSTNLYCKVLHTQSDLWFLVEARGIWL